MPALVVTVPLRVTDNVRVLRWTTCQSAPTTITDINGEVTLNPESIGPSGWYLAGFDDSGWAAPVLVADTSQSVAGPLPVPVPGFSSYLGGVGLTNQADPIWAVEPESDPMAALLIRWRFQMPAGTSYSAPDQASGLPLGPAVSVHFNHAFGQYQGGAGVVRYGYLNQTNPLGSINPYSLGLNYDIVSGPGRVAKAIPGQENLFCIAVSAPYRGTGCTAVRDAPFDDCFTQIQIICVYDSDSIANTWFGWGSNSIGELGVGSTDLTIGTPAPLVGDFIDVQAAGVVSAMGLTAAGRVYAWGGNSYGSLGNGLPRDFVAHPLPALVPSLSGIDRIWAFGDARPMHFARVGANHDLYAWGDELAVSLGLGLSNPPFAYEPTPRLSAQNVAQVAGSQHSLLLTDSGAIRGCGDHVQGELPGLPIGFNYSWTDIVAPVGHGLVVDIAVGQWFSVLLMADGTMWGSGRSLYGQLGFSGVTTDWVLVASRVALVSANFLTLYWTDMDGVSWALGYGGSGLLGGGLITSTAIPTQVQMPVQVVEWGISNAMVEGAYAARGVDGLVYVWGLNSSNQFDDSASNAALALPYAVRAVPLPVASLSGISALRGSPYMMFARTGGVTEPPPVVALSRARSYAQIVGD